MVYPPIRQFEQYEFTKYLQQTRRPDTTPANSAQRTLLAAAAVLVLVAVVAAYALAASTSLHL
jgi:hypothetical protein